jgi:predicted ester cyclase
VTALQNAVALGYVDHASSTASRTGISGYAQFLSDLRATCPDCRLVVAELVVGHDQAAVRVAINGPRQGTAVGGSGDGLPLAWSALDVLRLVGGRVAERWSQGELSLDEPLATDVPVELPAGSAVPRVSRFILRVGAGLPLLTASGPTLLVVEEGALAVRTEGVVGVDEGLANPVQVDHVVHQGERLVLTPGLRHTIRNDGPAPAVVLMVAIEPVVFWPELRPTAPLL